MTADSSQKKANSCNYRWVTGELRLSGMLDTRMLTLLRAIEETGSINQAAKLAGLSYKGAWQIIERANNIAPKVLITTATGGSKGGGTCLTAAGQALLDLFTRLERQHEAFLAELNHKLTCDSELMLLLKPLTIKTSATSQLFGRVIEIVPGAVNCEVHIELKGGENIVASVTLDEWWSLSLSAGCDVLVLINAAEIMLAGTELPPLSARNCLQGQVIRIVQDGVDAEVTLRLPGEDTLSALITSASLQSLGLTAQSPCWAFFKSNALILAALPAKDETPPDSASPSVIHSE